jgi:hypothetical protein
MPPIAHQPRVWTSPEEDDLMKIRAHVTIDAVCAGYLEAAAFEKRIEALVAELGKEFQNVEKLKTKIVRAPRQKRITSEPLGKVT